MTKDGRRKIMYESDISDSRWIAYDLPGNVGWILYFIGLILIFVKKPAFLKETVMFCMMMVAVIPALFMLVGISELISERIHKLDRVLPRTRLMRGFGALTVGGVRGTVIAAITLIWIAGTVIIAGLVALYQCQGQGFEMAVGNSGHGCICGCYRRSYDSDCPLKSDLGGIRTCF